MPVNLAHVLAQRLSRCFERSATVPRTNKPSDSGRRLKSLDSKSGSSAYSSALSDGSIWTVTWGSVSVACSDITDWFPYRAFDEVEGQGFDLLPPLVSLDAATTAVAKNGAHGFDDTGSFPRLWAVVV